MLIKTYIKAIDRELNEVRRDVDMHNRWVKFYAIRGFVLSLALEDEELTSEEYHTLCEYFNRLSV